MTSADLLQTAHESGYGGYVALEYEGFAWGHAPDPLQILREGRDFLLSHIAAVTG